MASNLKLIPYNNLKVVHLMLRFLSLIVILTILSNPVFSQSPTYLFGGIGMSPNAQMSFFGDVYGSTTPVNLAGSVYFKTDSSLVKSPSSITINNLHFEMNKALVVETELGVTGQAFFDSGIIYTDRNNLNNYYVHFNTDAFYNQLNPNSFVDGTVVKTGNTYFEFPIGNGSLVNTLTVHPTNSTVNSYQAYFKDDVLVHTSTYDNSSSCIRVFGPTGYWYYNRLAGTEDAVVTLKYSENMLGSVATCSNVIASWNGSTWLSEGNGGVTGDNSVGGTLTSGTGCTDCGDEKEVTNYNFLTIAASSSTLPVTWLSFFARYQGDNTARIVWTLAEEKGNSYFVLERSSDGKEWQNIAKINSLGDTEKLRSYQYYDKSFFGSSIIYYRIKQVDFDGKSTYNSNIISLNLGSSDFETITVYPNPTISFLNVSVIDDYVGNTLSVVNTLGIERIKKDKISKDESLFVGKLPNGVYVLRLINPLTQEVIKESKFIKL